MLDLEFDHSLERQDGGVGGLLLFFRSSDIFWMNSSSRCMMAIVVFLDPWAAMPA